MILVDTSVWVDHFRNGNDRLRDLLLNDKAACHPMVIGELACGHLKRRDELLALLLALPTVERASDEDALFFIDRHHLWGRGLGLVDIHLLASCSLSQIPLWTLDAKLRRAAEDVLKM